MSGRNDLAHSLMEFEDEKYQGSDQLPRGSTKINKKKLLELIIQYCVNLLVSDRYKIERVKNNKF